jgi:hypothetical protein
MHGLRHRAREEYQTANSSRLSHDVFSHLPVELWFQVFDHLAITEILNLRLVNRNFKSIVDSFSSIWSHRLCLRLDLDDKQLNLNQFQLFLQFLVGLNLVKVKCSHRLSKEELRRIDSPIIFTANQTIAVKIERLNILSLQCLNLFASITQKLQVDSFVSTNHSWMPFGELNITSSANLNVFTHLNCLKLECSYIWLKDKVECQLRWRQIFDFNLLLNKMDVTFPNLKHLHLSNYDGSLAVLFEKLTRLKSLKCLELVSCVNENEIGGSNSELEAETTRPIKKKLKLDSMYLTGLQDVNVKYILGYLVDSSQLKVLGWHARSSPTKLAFTFLDDLKNLKSLVTNVLTCESLDVARGIWDMHKTIESLAKLEKIYLNEPIVFECPLSSSSSSRKLQSSSTCSSYSFDLRLFNALFRDEMNVLEEMVVTFVESCSQLDAIVEQVIGFFKSKASFLKYLKLKFKCKILKCDKCTTANLMAFDKTYLTNLNFKFDFCKC